MIEDRSSLPVSLQRTYRIPRSRAAMWSGRLPRVSRILVLAALLWLAVTAGIVIGTWEPPQPGPTAAPSAAPVPTHAPERPGLHAWLARSVTGAAGLAATEWCDSTNEQGLLVSSPRYDRPPRPPRYNPLSASASVGNTARMVEKPEMSNTSRTVSFRPNRRSAPPAALSRLAAPSRTRRPALLM